MSVLIGAPVMTQLTELEIAQSVEATVAASDRRRPGRLDNINPELIPILRGQEHEMKVRPRGYRPDCGAAGAVLWRSAVGSAVGRNCLCRLVSPVQIGSFCRAVNRSVTWTRQNGAMARWQNGIGQ